MSDSDKGKLESFKLLAERAGLNLSEADVTRLFSGFERNRTTAAKLRGLISPELEPATVFSTARPAEAKE